MAKWGKPTEETINIINEILSKTNLEQFVKVKVIINDEQSKDVIKLKKLSPDIKFALGNDLLLIINENIFEQLPTPQQFMVIEEILSGVHYNNEFDRLEITSQDVKTYSGFLRKYTYDKYEVLRESIKSLYDKEKENKN